LNETQIGWGQKIALIRFFYKKDPEKMTLDEFAKHEAELIYLSKIGILGMANIPLKLS
jgi:hypothetical protein